MTRDYEPTTRDVPALKCYECGKPADDECPLCGKAVCQLCAEREGSFCCDEAAEAP